MLLLTEPRGIAGSARPARGFSLIEVVVAVGIFAIAIVAVIGLLSPIGKSVSEVQESDDAARLVGVLQNGLQQEFNRIKNYDTFMGYLGDESIVFYADRSGEKIGLASAQKNSSALWSNHAEKFFAITLHEIPANDGLKPNSSSGFLAFNMKIVWPAYLANGAELTDKTQQSVMIVPCALVR